MLPLSLLKSAAGCPVLIELKNGETYNAKLEKIDLWMNMTLTDVVRTSCDATRFWRMEEVYVRGNTIKYIRVPELVLGIVEEERHAREAARESARSRRDGRGRGRRGGRGGRGSGRRGGRGTW